MTALNGSMPKDPKLAKARLAQTRPSLTRGDEVLVEFPGVRPYTGRVDAVKPSLESGWWVDVRRSDGMSDVVPASRVRPKPNGRR